MSPEKLELSPSYYTDQFFYIKRWLCDLLDRFSDMSTTFTRHPVLCVELAMALGCPEEAGQRCHQLKKQKLPSTRLLRIRIRLIWLC